MSYLYNKKCTKYVYDRMVSRKRKFKSWVQPYHKLIRTRPNIKKQNKKDGKGRKWTKRLSKLLGYELGIMSVFLSFSFFQISLNMLILLFKYYFYNEK